MAQLASYGYYIGLKLANVSTPFRYETLEPSRVALHNPETILTNLRKFSSYVITVQAFNEAGAGPKSFPIVARTNEDGKLKTSDKINTKSTWQFLTFSFFKLTYSYLT